MRIDGVLSAPPGFTGQFPVVVHFFYNQNNFKGYPVAATQPAFATPFGTAATTTGSLPSNGGAVQTTWSAFMPYAALGVQHGGFGPGPYGQPVYYPFTTYLFAEPVLYLDNFGLRSGGLVNFFVNL